MSDKQTARSRRAVFGRARDLSRFKPSPVSDTTRSIVVMRTDLGFCSTDVAFVPISMPRIPTLHGAFE